MNWAADPTRTRERVLPACLCARCSLLAARPASVSRFDRLSPVARNVNGWQPTLERIRDKYGDLTSFIEAICGHYDGVEGGGGPSADAEGPGGASPSAPSAPPTRHGEDCLLCLQEVKITQKKLTSSNCCMSEENLESFHATSEVKPGYSACWTPSHSTRSLDALIRLAHSTRSLDVHAGGTSVYASVPRWRPRGVCFDLFGDAWMSTETSPEILQQQQQQQPPLDNEGRFCAVHLPQNITLVNVYVPNAGLGKSKGSNVGDGTDSSGHGPARLSYKLAFYRRLLAYCRHQVEVSRRHVVLVGDFNACFDARDVHPLIGMENAFLPAEVDALRAFTAHGFVDVWRALHGDSDGSSTSTTYTCFDQKTNARHYNRGVRIDFCLVSAGLVGRVRRCEVVGSEVVPARWSDHCALYVEIEGEGERIGEAEAGKSVKEWVALRRKLTNSGQRKLADFFSRKRKAGED